ncbi:hypothetical protein MRX96_026491 [Rhipicephalus microplus]
MVLIASISTTSAIVIGGDVSSGRTVAVVPLAVVKLAPASITIVQEKADGAGVVGKAASKLVYGAIFGPRGAGLKSSTGYGYSGSTGGAAKFGAGYRYNVGIGRARKSSSGYSYGSSDYLEVSS